MESFLCGSWGVFPTRKGLSLSRAASTFTLIHPFTELVDSLCARPTGQRPLSSLRHPSRPPSGGRLGLQAPRLPQRKKLLGPQERPEACVWSQQAPAWPPLARKQGEALASLQRVQGEPGGPSHPVPPSGGLASWPRLPSRKPQRQAPEGRQRTALLRPSGSYFWKHRRTEALGPSPNNACP